MADYPIIFSAPMVKALLDGRKTQTRRLLYTRSKNIRTARVLQGHPPPVGRLDDAGFPTDIGPNECWALSPWQKGKPGDRLWVRESIQAVVDAEEFDAIKYLADNHVARSIANSREEADRYAETLYCYRGRKGAPDKMTGAPVPSIHMPRWASRLTLIVTATKIERLQDISGPDAIAEGIVRYHYEWRGAEYPLPDVAYEAFAGSEWRHSDPTDAFADLWRRINGPDAWDANPEVIALTFRVIRANIDSELMPSGQEALFA